jgi:hypothetical protein
LQAQEFGVRVHLLGICSHPNSGQKYSQSQFLLQEADVTHLWTAKTVSEFLSHQARAFKPVPTAPKLKVDAAKAISEIAKESADAIDPQLIPGLVGTYTSSKRIPPEVVGPLLGKARKVVGFLTSDQKSQIRRSFIENLITKLPKQDESK